jgi:multicomponent Na+:H+ antiporter subunit D
MSWLLPLPVAVSLAGAAVLVAVDRWLPERVKEYPALIVSAATTVLSMLVLTHTGRTAVLHWHGGWQPRHGVAIGVAFVAEPLGAGMAALAGVLVTAALLFSWHYLEEAPLLYRVLMLALLAGMSGFSLSADLFNMFVWFELMGVAAYALAGYRIEALGPLQGAINFAITNTIGAFAILFGTALLYGRTGALNLAQIGKSLAGASVDGLLVVAFTLAVVGFLIKAAMVPFHFWLADAYAAAPAPVCAVFAGAMCELGLLGIARMYWTVFAAPLGGHAADVRDPLLAVGIATALLGAVMAFLQRHLKRLLAYATISHLGATLAAVALLDGKSLAGAANLVLSHAFLIGGLFLATGALLRELGDIDELRLHGRGRSSPFLGAIFGAAGIGLIGLPYVGTFLGHSQLDEGARLDGLGWAVPLLLLAAALAAAAVLRATLRIFLGWGPKEDPLLSREPHDESEAEHEANVPVMLVVTSVLVVLGLLASVVPGLEDRTGHAADRFRDRHAYVERVLHGKVERAGPPSPSVLHAAPTASVLYGLGTALVTLAAVAFGLYRRRLPGAARALGARILSRPVEILRSAHTGVVGDYVMWLTVGTAVLGGIWALTLR